MAESAPEFRGETSATTTINNLCACVSYARSLGAKLPRGYDAIEYVKWINILPKSPLTVGSVAIFKYGEGREKHHLAYVTGFQEEGFVVNEEISLKGKCVKRTRLVEWDDKALVGFYKPLD